ncbi:MAG: hypothetical protein HY812_09545 [Planctomycetes bacterium]|nr:hypothetical protein [Planctomycetota bacterium]
MVSPSPTPLYYTFGNHWHWVDLQWLWGYRTLPDSIRDMLWLIDKTGARGNVNFDGVGYEKLAAESPAALAELREAVQDGRVEVVGASYGQPYGLFHGGESNVRQRLFGVRAVLRLFGVRPRAFWEEEFDFFPQLPQILKKCGYTGASLFFQWTWHTPSVPEEQVPLILWEGIDGSRLRTLAKTGLCLHQWPEDFDGKLDSAFIEQLEKPAIVQWLELLPSPDWMCRGELLLPRLDSLFRDRRFDVRPRTLSGLIDELDDGSAPVRRYGMDDVFHGMSLGKNADCMLRWSSATEARLLAAESAAALAGLCGRPYPSWDVYPTWELEEAWRELLAAEHHDNHECEGLCGYVGKRQFEKALGHADDVLCRTLRSFARRARGERGALLLFNPLGWRRTVSVAHAGSRFAVEMPACGYRLVSNEERAAHEELPATQRLEGGTIILERGDLRVIVDSRAGLIRQVECASFPDGLLAPERPLLEFAMRHSGAEDRFASAEVSAHDDGSVHVLRRGQDSASLEYTIALREHPRRVEVEFLGAALPRPDPGMHAGLRTTIAPRLDGCTLFHDTPYAIAEIRAEHDHLRKYPTGEWMTSQQWFETIRRPFSALSLVDMVSGDRGLLVVHNGSQAFFRTEHGIENLLHMYDPWDEDSCTGDLAGARLIFFPHGALDHQERFRLAAETRTSLLVAEKDNDAGDLAAALGLLELDGAGLITACYRECGHAAEGFALHFGREVRDPFVVRVVEHKGEGGVAMLAFPGAARAARTNLLGEIEEELDTFPVAPRAAFSDLPRWAVRLVLAPHEIATVMLDLELGRQIPRNLDDYRSVWANVHRVGEDEEEA